MPIGDTSANAATAAAVALTACCLCRCAGQTGSAAPPDAVLEAQSPRQGDRRLVGSLWVGNIPLNQANEESIRQAWTKAGMVGVVKSTVRVKADKQNGSWALLAFADAHAMQTAARVPIVVSDVDGNPVVLRIEIAKGKKNENGLGDAVYESHTPRQERSLWVGQLPLKIADEASLLAVLKDGGVEGVTSCSITIKTDRLNSCSALLTFSNSAFARAAQHAKVSVTSDAGEEIQLRFAADRGQVDADVQLVDSWVVTDVSSPLASSLTLGSKERADGLSLDAWLARQKLERYSAKFKEAGYDELEFLKDAGEDQLDDILAQVDMKAPHIRTFKRAWQELAGSAPSTSQRGVQLMKVHSSGAVVDGIDMLRSSDSVRSDDSDILTRSISRRRYMSLSDESTPDKSKPPSELCIFGSQRFPITKEAWELQRALASVGIFLKFVEMQAGLDIDHEVYEWIKHCDSFLVFGTKGYGEDTGNSACTYHEIKFAQAKRKHIILLRMIPWDEEFDQLIADVLFSQNMFTLRWDLGTPMPEALPSDIAESLGVAADTNAAAEASMVAGSVGATPRSMGEP